MSEIKTPNFRLSTCIEASTGHQYVFTDRRTGTTIYFDQVRVFDPPVNSVKLKRFKGDRVTRAGHIKSPEDLPDVIIEGLEAISKNDSFPSTDVVVSADAADLEVTA